MDETEAPDGISGNGRDFMGGVSKRLKYEEEASLLGCGAGWSWGSRV